MKLTKETMNEILKNMDQNKKDMLNAGQKREQLASFLKSLPKVSNKAKSEILAAIAKSMV